MIAALKQFFASFRVLFLGLESLFNVFAILSGVAEKSALVYDREASFDLESKTHELEQRMIAIRANRAVDQGVIAAAVPATATGKARA